MLRFPGFYTFTDLNKIDPNNSIFDFKLANNKNVSDFFTLTNETGINLTVSVFTANYTEASNALLPAQRCQNYVPFFGINAWRITLILG